MVGDGEGKVAPSAPAFELDRTSVRAKIRRIGEKLYEDLLQPLLVAVMRPRLSGASVRSDTPLSISRSPICCVTSVDQVDEIHFREFELDDAGIDGRKIEDVV